MNEPTELSKSESSDTVPLPRQHPEWCGAFKVYQHDCDCGFHDAIEDEARRAVLDELRAAILAAPGFETNTVNRIDLYRAMDRLAWRIG